MTSFKLIFPSVFIILTCFTATSQEWSWANRFGFKGAESRSLIGGSDKDGNLYCAVRSVYTIVRPYEVQYNLLKIDDRGKLIWSKDISQYSGGKIATDQEGNTYLAFNDAMAKIDATGSLLWEKSTHGQRFFGQISLQDGEIIISGIESDKQAFVAEYSKDGELISSIKGLKTGILASDAQKNFFIYTSDYPDKQNGNRGRLLRYSSAGELTWEKSVPYESKSIIADKDGSIYIAGSFYWGEPIDIEGTKFSKPRIENDYTFHQFFIKYDSTGKVLWYKIFTNGDPTIKLNIGPDGNLYYLTSFSGQMTMNGFPITNSGSGLLLAKISSEGKLLWREQSLYSLLNHASPEDFFVNEKYEVLISGQLLGSGNFGQYSVTSEDGMYNEMFVTKLSQNNVVKVQESSTLSTVFQVYPNPSGDIFTLSTLTVKSGHITLTVTDLQGRVIFSSQNVNQIDLSAFPKGVYLLNVDDGKERSFHKIVKN